MLKPKQEWVIQENNHMCYLRTFTQYVKHNQCHDKQKLHKSMKVLLELYLEWCVAVRCDKNHQARLEKNMEGFLVASSLGALVKFDGIVIFYPQTFCLCQKVIIQLLANINLIKHKWLW